MEEKEYPYLGARDFNGKQVIIFFNEKDYGTVVLSELNDNDSFKLGRIGDFEESFFPPLEKDKRVVLSN